MAVFLILILIGSSVLFVTITECRLTNDLISTSIFCADTPSFGFARCT